MSVRNLISTTVQASTFLVRGTINAGNCVGEGLEWITRQVARINSEETIRNEERAHRLSLAEREAELVNRAKTIALADVKQQIKELDKLLGIE